MILFPQAIYFGDTGSAHQALALCADSLPAGDARRAAYTEAMDRYFHFVTHGCENATQPPK